MDARPVLGYDLPVDLHPALLDKRVGISPRTDARVSDELVDAHAALVRRGVRIAHRQISGVGSVGRQHIIGSCTRRRRLVPSDL